MAALAGHGPRTATASMFQCRSDTTLGTTRLPAKKGIALDDSTLRWCAQQIPSTWPNSNESMTSIRLFRAWDSGWAEAEKDGAWSRLVQYVVDAKARVLLGTPITCDEAADNQAWVWTKQLLGKLPPGSVMGLAIGNELDLLQYKDPAAVSAQCLQDIWELGYFWRQFQRFVAEFDALGFGGVTITSVFTGLGLFGEPFYEVPGKARVKTFLTKATQNYGSRFAFTFNFYPYFDPGMPLDAGTTDQCSGSLAAASCWGEGCLVPSMTRMARRKMGELTGNSSGILWIGETGWSSRLSGSLSTAMAACPAWSSMDTFQNFYRGFLDWNLSLGGGAEAPDHAFWFTMRDSRNFGVDEYFGLISECDMPACKVASAGYSPEAYTAFQGPAKQHCTGTPSFNGWARGEAHCRDLCTLDPTCNFYGIWPRGYDGQHWCMLTPSCDALADVSYDVTIHRRKSLAPASPSSTTTASTPSPGSGNTTTPPPTRRPPGGRDTEFSGAPGRHHHTDLPLPPWLLPWLSPLLLAAAVGGQR